MDHKKLMKIIDTADGFERELNGSGHYSIRRHGRLITTMSKSPSDSRSTRNLVSQLRRAGLKVPH